MLKIDTISLQNGEFDFRAFRHSGTRPIKNIRGIMCVGNGFLKLLFAILPTIYPPATTINRRKNKYD